MSEEKEQQDNSKDLKAWYEEEQPKMAEKEFCDKIPPQFDWTDNKVAEVSRLIYQNRMDSDVWTSDYIAELGIIREFKLHTVLNEKMSALRETPLGNSEYCAVKRVELHELVKYLSQHQAELQSL